MASTVELLKKTHDSQRILQKISLGRGDADDLIGLARTIETTQKIIDLLSTDSHKHQSTIDTLISELDVPIELAKRITKAIDEEGLMQQQRIEESEATINAALMEGAVLEDEEGLEKGTGKEKRRTVGPRVGKRLLSEKEMERLEAWICHKRFACHGRYFLLLLDRVIERKTLLIHLCVLYE
jgi:DNA mismatch repair ATPase MutS